MKHLKHFLLFCALLLTAIGASAQPFWTGTAASDWTGAGTENDPYLITTAEQLAGIAAAVGEGNEFDGEYIKLANDLYLSNPADEPDNKPQWTPIGGIKYTQYSAWNYDIDTLIFRGTFDGAGHAIHNMYYSVIPDFGDWENEDDPTIDPQPDFSGWHKGFFGYTDGATIKNLNLNNAVMVGAATIGGLVAYSKNSTISNCSITGAVRSASDYIGGEAGGLVGNSDEHSTIENCHSAANVYAPSNSGGFVGSNHGTIRNCYATGKSSTKGAAGGFVGNNMGYIESCYATGEVHKTWSREEIGTATGGFAGGNGDYATITNCYATGNVTGAGTTVGAAGFVGNNGAGSIITNCYATGNVVASSRAAGFVDTNGYLGAGWGDTGTPGIIVNCFAVGTTTSHYSDSWAVGFARDGHWDGPVVNCYYNVETYGDKFKIAGAEMRTTAQMQTEAFVDTLNMMSALFGLNTWEYHAGAYPTPTGAKATNLTDYLEGGSGTESDPYRIKTKAQLENFALYVNKGWGFPNKYIKLEADIVLNAPQAEWGNTMPTQWTPIGGQFVYADRATEFGFMGTFDGSHYEIRNLYINNAKDYQGLFGLLKGATIKNLGITNAWIKASYCVGILAGKSAYIQKDGVGTVIKQCHTSGVLEAGFNLGGFTGLADRTYLFNCYSTAVLSSVHTFTGIHGDVTNSYFAGKVTGGKNTGIYDVLCKITNSFYDSESGGAAKGISQTTAEMQSKELVNKLNYWVTATNENETEPYLYWQHNVDDYPTFTATVPPHTVTYNSNGGTPIVAQQILDASRTAPPVAPEKTGYVFAGWYADEALTTYFDFETEIITQNITLYAKWVEPFTFDISWYNPFGDTYTIRTKQELAGLAQLVNGTSGEYASPIDFNGKTIKLANDILLNDTSDWKYWGEHAYAVPWTPIGVDQYIRFNGTFEGGGYEIIGMYIRQTSGGNNFGLFGYTNTNSVIKNVGIIASYVEGYTTIGSLVGLNAGLITECYAFANVSTNGYDGGLIGGLVGGNDGNINNCFSIGNVLGYHTVGGLVGGSTVGTVTNCYAAATITALSDKYIGGVIGYGFSPTSYFDADIVGANAGGIGKTTVLMRQKGTYVDWDFTEIWGRNNAINNGYPYLRFMLDQYVEDDDDITVTVTFNSNGGNEVAPQVISLGAKATKPDALEHPSEYATFIDWYTDEALTTTFSFNNIIMSDTTIYAKWTIPTWTLSFVTNNGISGSIPNQRINYGECGVRPEDPTRANYTFVGWYADYQLTTLFDFDVPRAASITVYAKWAKNKHTVTFVTNGSDPIDPIIREYGARLAEPATPIRAEYFFDGWFADEELTVEFNFNNVIIKDTTIYLGWTPRAHMTLPYSNDFATAASTSDFILRNVTWSSDNGGELAVGLYDAFIELPMLPAGVMGCRIIVGNTTYYLSLHTSTDGINYTDHGTVFRSETNFSLPDGTRYVKLRGTSSTTLTSISVVALGHMTLPYNNNFATAASINDWIVSGVTWSSDNSGQLAFSRGSYAELPILPAGVTDCKITVGNTDPDLELYTSTDGVSYTNHGTVFDSETIFGLPDGTRYIKLQGGRRTTLTSISITAKTVVAPVDVTGVSLNKTTATVTIGSTEQLTATVLPANASNKAVSWSSSNTAVATVSSNGLVTAVSAGTATITVTTTDGSKTAQCVVTVNPVVVVNVTGVSLNKTTATVTVGSTEQLTATVLPANASNKAVSWSSSNTAVATVSSNGLVTAVSAGTATITVTTTDGAKTAQCVVTVNPPAATPSLFIDFEEAAWEGSGYSKRSVSASSGSWIVSGVGVMDANDHYNGNRAIRFRGGNSNDQGDNLNRVEMNFDRMGVGTVSFKYASYSSGHSGGILDVEYSVNKGQSWTLAGSTPAAPKWADGGSVMLNASFNINTSSSVRIRIVKRYVGSGSVSINIDDVNISAYAVPTTVAVTSVALNKNTATVTVGSTEQLIATVSPTNATNKAVSWSSSNTAVATVNSNGLVTAVSAGTATITVTTTDGAKTAQCVVTVVNPIINVSSVALSKTTTTLIVSDTEQLTATVLPANASNKAVSWSSSNTAVATVSSNGLVTAISAGIATITVTTTDGAKTAQCVVTVRDDVSVQNPTANQLELISSEGRIEMSFAGSSDVRVYTVGGILVISKTADSYFNHPLHEGAYIVRVGSAVMKVLVTR